ncbi:MAG: hypothetical protein NT027_12850 [Proteobacteria bacterium]|nr:hypothetical protein [Pseudomonadota bacterium]
MSIKPKVFIHLIIAASLGMFLSTSCIKTKQKLSKTNSQDHMDADYVGIIPLEQGSPQRPNVDSCLSEISKADSSSDYWIGSDASMMSKDMIVDLAWQFPDIKNQEIGDCYVYAGVAGVEAAMNRVRKVKPQIAISEPYMTARLFMTNDHVNEFRDRVLRRSFSTYKNQDDFLSTVFSSGQPEWSARAALQYWRELVFAGEFDYKDLNSFLDFIRQAIEREKLVNNITYGDLDKIIGTTQKLIVNEKSTAAKLAELFRLYAANKAANQVDGNEFLKKLDEIKSKKVKDDTYKEAINALEKASVKPLIDFNRSAADQAFEVSDRWRQYLGALNSSGPIEDTPFGANRSQSNAASVKSSDESKADQPAQNDLALLMNERKKCWEQSEELRKKIAEKMCRGIPVIVGMTLDGTLEPKEAPRDMTEMEKKLAGPSRGNARLDPSKVPILQIPINTGPQNQHAAHAMVLDGIVKFEQKPYWRFRNSWASSSPSGSVFVPFSETCRIFSANVVVLGDEK